MNKILIVDDEKGARDSLRLIFDTKYQTFLAKSADEALNILRYHPNRGARMLEKVVKSALANAEDRHAHNLGGLMVAEVRVDGGPMIKRMKPKSRGMAAIIWSVGTGTSRTRI